MSDLIQIVDENDQPIAVATKQEARGQGLIHRLASVMLDDGNGRLLLQLRSPHKDLSPNCWDCSASGHVDAGEGYETAAYRELAEELGVSGIVLTELGKDRYNKIRNGNQLNRFVKFYTGTITETPTNLQASEIAAVQWFTIAEIRQLIAEQPDHATNSVRHVVERYFA